MQATTDRTREPGSADVIRVQGVTREFAMGGEIVHALRPLDLVVPRNQYLAIMGPSGSGKSTLMNILGCLDTPTRGEYWLNGIAVSQMSDTALAHVRNREIGFVFQTFNLLARATALRNVELPLLYAGVPAPERRRRATAAVARALVTEPALLLADEPTGNLDSRTGEEVMAMFEQLHAEGQTIVVVTHDAGVGAHAQRRLVLRDGRVESDAVNGAQRVAS
jgi:putative ABC transport system ATP-binding protein